MWTCPRCAHKFFNRNQSHSCGGYTVEDFLKGRPDAAVDLFHHFISEYKKIGGFELHPVKTRVALLAKMRFCAINKIGADHIAAHLVLTSRYEKAACFFKMDNLGDRFFIHHFRISKKSDVNTLLKKYMKLAYAVGNRAHVAERNKKLRVME